MEPINILNFKDVATFTIQHMIYPSHALYVLSESMNENKTSMAADCSCGMMVAVNFDGNSENAKWYRGVIKSNISKSGFEKIVRTVQYEVFLMDEAKTVTLPGNELFELPERFWKTEPQAFVVKLEGVNPTGRSAEENVSVEIFLHQILKEHMFASMEKVRQVGDDVFVKLFVNLKDVMKDSLFCINDQINKLDKEFAQNKAEAQAAEMAKLAIESESSADECAASPPPTNGSGMGRGRAILAKFSSSLQTNSPPTTNGSRGRGKAILEKLNRTTVSNEASENKLISKVETLRALIQNAKTRFNPPVVWSDTDSTVRLGVGLCCSAMQKPKIAIEDDTFLFYFEHDKLYTLDVRLFAKCRPRAAVETSGPHIVIKITKQENKKWTRLLEMKEKVHWLRPDLLALQYEDADEDEDAKCVLPTREREKGPKTIKKGIFDPESSDDENDSEDEFELPNSDDAITRDYGLGPMY